MSILLLHWTKY